MPLRSFTREQAWLLPPSLGELLPTDHPARYVAAFVADLSREEWTSLGIAPEGDALGRPAYDPEALLCIWLYGFMMGVRSSRKLEAACRDQIPMLWLTGFQQPDHNTLWRFYQAHRDQMRVLLKQTVKTAVDIGLIDLAMQAVDGTKVAGNVRQPVVGRKRKEWKALEEPTEGAIADLEAQNAEVEDPPPPRLPEELEQEQALAGQVREARRRNWRDEEAVLQKGHHSYLQGYNAQAVVTPVRAEEEEEGGLFIVAAELSQAQGDTEQLLPMLEEATAMGEQAPEVLLGDAGYFSGENLEACAQRQQRVIIPDPQQHGQQHPYHKEAFVYDAAQDVYHCPEGQELRRVERARGRDGSEGWSYQARASVCRACPAFGVCTKDRKGRRIKRGAHEEVLAAHRAWIKTEEARDLYRQRAQSVEPVFGITKECLGLRRLLLKGVRGARAEWLLTAVAFNLRSLWKRWRRSQVAAPLAA